MKKNPNTFFRALVPVAGACLLLAGCASAPSGPTRINTGSAEAITTMDLDPADYMEAARKVSAELLVFPVLTLFTEASGRNPRLDIGAIRNATRENIVIELFAERVMEALLDSGQVTLVAHDRAAIAANGLDRFLRDDKISLSDQADFYLEGVISLRQSRRAGVMEKTYTFMLRLNDRGRNQVWKRNVDITKQGADTNRRGGVSLF